MKKFFIILFKEIRELLKPQTLVPFLVVVVLFYFVGQYINKQSAKNKGPQKIAISDQDNSELSRVLIAALKQGNLDPIVYPSNESLTSEMRKDKIISGLIIPSDFEKSVQAFQPKKIETYTLLSDLSISAISKYLGGNSAVGIINNIISTQYLAAKAPGASPELFKNPVGSADFTVIKEKTAEASPAAVIGFLSKQNYIIPVVLFLIIIVASQMIATSVASEKEDKTLETLLTAPISRKMLVVAKMIAAGIVAILMAGVYLLGFRSYISGVTSTGPATTTATVSSSTLQSLNLVLRPTDYLLLGALVFLGILVALAIAMILGAFAEDVKSVQTTIAPLMVLMIIPYFLTLFFDINTLPNLARYIIYAIPFTHIFLAMPNLYLHNYSLVLFGIFYDLVIFIIFVWLAAWIFSTDKIMTLKFNFGRKKK